MSDVRMGLTPLHQWSGKEDLLKGAPVILDAIIKRAQKDWSRQLSRQDALDTLNKLAVDTGPYGLQATVLNDSHLLIWSYGGPWYAPSERWLTEQFFVRIGRGSSADAFTAIDQLADNIGATGVIMATSLAADDAALGRLLAARGYSPMSSQHFKAYLRQ